MQVVYRDSAERKLKVNRKPMIRNLYNQIQHTTLKTKRERKTHIKIDKRSRDKNSIPNEQLYLKKVVSQLRKLKQQQHLFLPILCFKLQNRTIHKA